MIWLRQYRQTYTKWMHTNHTPIMWWVAMLLDSTYRPLSSAVFFNLRANRMLIHIIGMLPSLSAVLLYLLDAQLFLLPQRIPHKERNSSDKQGVAYSPQGRGFLCYAVYLGRHVLNQLHFDIACKYLSLLMEPHYQGNKTGCYRLVQITWYSGANESLQKLFWPTIDFKNGCIRRTPPSLCSYSYVWIYFCGELICISFRVHNFFFFVIVYFLN